MNSAQNNSDLGSSFRDPSGFVFVSDGKILRQVNKVYKENYDHLINCGLYNVLIDSGLLISHNDVDIKHACCEDAYKVLMPENVQFISYPYEWCFSQLKDAALVTLRIQKESLKFGMSLKDSSAYNIQFHEGKPMLIDILSFEKYQECSPWVAYRQFCQHFLGPLALMCYADIRLNQLLRIYIDGIPIDLTSELLPMKTYLNPSLLIHVHMHAKSQRHCAGKSIKASRSKMNRLSMLGLIDSLESAVRKISWRISNSQWAHYYDKEANYTEDAFKEKTETVDNFLSLVNPKNVWDLGANIGTFSRIASQKGIPVISFDIDPACVEINYQSCVKDNEKEILPLILDLVNPSPAIGWENKERFSLLERGPADCVMALAIIHHLAIANNLPLGKIAEFLSKICNWLIIELVPKSDTQVQRMLSSREDIFSEYTQPNFEESFRRYFSIEKFSSIRDSKRTLYLMKRNAHV